MGENFQIENAVLEDVNSIKEIEIECELAPWMINDYELELSREDSIFFVVKCNSKVIAFLLSRLITSSYSNTDNTIELYNVGVRRNYRNKGIGRLLLKELITKGVIFNVQNIFLEVRKSNKTAISLYNGFGFKVIYDRKDFYTNPKEDGLTMKLDLIQNVELDMK